MEENTTLDLQTENVPQTETRVCPNCKATLQESQKFCPLCGTEYTLPTEPTNTPTIPVCAACGNELAEGATFCTNCGAKQEQPKPIVEEKTSILKKKWFLPALIGGGVVIIAIVIVLILAFRTIPVEFIKLSESSVELKEGETTSISCTVYPDKATDKTVIWTSSDTSVATVNSYGLITAVKRGTCTITAQCGDYTEKVTLTIKTNIDFKSIYNEYCVAKWASVGSDNSYLSIDDNPYDYEDYYIDAADAAIEKINRALGLPDALYSDMLQTTWSMGKQKETYERIGVEVTWTYHPDKGLEVTYKLINN